MKLQTKELKSDVVFDFVQKIMFVGVWFSIKEFDIKGVKKYLTSFF